MKPSSLELADATILWAGLLALLPILLYLIDRRRARKVDWAAMQFFGDARRSLRWMRLQDFLLLAVRCGLLALLPLCLSRPHAEVQTVSRPVHAGQRSVVLIVDDSPSTGWAPTDKRGPTRWELARDAALGVLESLRPGDEAVLLAAGDAGPGEARASTSPAAARRRVLGMAPRSPRRSLLDLLDDAVRHAPAAGASTREIYVVTDLQATAWTFEARRWQFLGKQLAAMSPRPTVAILDLSGGEPALNRAVVGLASTRPLVGAGEEAAIVALVRQLGLPGEARVTLSVDGEPRESRTVSVAPGEPAAVRFEQRFPEAKVYRVEASIEADGLRADDRRFLALDVRERLHVLIVDDRAGTSRLESEAGLLELAYSPRARGLPVPGTLFSSSVAKPDALAGSLDAFPVVVVANVEHLGEEAIERLEDHVRLGGGALFFTGARADLALFNSRLHRAGKGLLPLEILGREPEGIEAVLATPRIPHPALAPFLEPGKGDFSKIRVHRPLRAQAPRSGVEVLLALEGGSAFMAEKAFGRGRVIQVTAGATHRDSTFPAQPFFLPWLHNVTAHLATRGESPRSLEAGQPLVTDVGPAERDAAVELEGPGGVRLEVTPVEEDGRKRCRAGDASIPGFYSFRFRSGAGVRTSVHAVNLPPGESELTPLDEEGRKSIVEALGASIVSSAADLLGREVVVRDRRDFWRPLAAAILLLLAVEVFLTRLTARERVPLRQIEPASGAGAEPPPDKEEELSCSSR